MKRLMIFAVALAGAGVMSCSKSDIQRPEITGEPNALPVQVSLHPDALVDATPSFTATKAAAKENQSIDVVFGEPDTKSTTELATAVDSKVINVVAIQFDASGNLIGSPFYTDNIPTPGAGSTGIDATYALSVNLTTNTNTGGKVYFITNVSPSLFNTATASTEAKLKQALYNIGTEFKPTAASGIPMVGVYTGAVSSSATIGNVNMKRLVAKVILKYKVSNANFTVTGIRMRNVPANITVCGEDQITSGAGIWPDASTASFIDYPAEVLTSATTDGDYKKFVWYVPENLRGTNSSVTSVGDRTLDKSNSSKGTYIEIKGDYRSSAHSERATFNVLLGAAGTAAGDFNVKRNNVYTVTVDIQGTNTSDHRLTVETFDMNNCAMIRPNSGDAGAVTFDIRKVNDNSWQNLPTLSASAALRAEILWQDGNVINAGDVSLDKANGLLTVKSTKTTEGNAVVALYNATSGGEILWSWHIWVTGYQPNTLTPATRTANTAYTVTGGQVHTYGTAFMEKNPGKVIMDRNLGATATSNDGTIPSAAVAPNTFGLFYQWGRKDPLPRWVGSGETQDTKALPARMYAANGTTDITASMGYNITDGSVTATPVATAAGTGNSLAYSIKNPAKFITSASGLYDWYTNSTATSAQNNALWGDGAPVKSAYDPCPKGWRIAPNGTWDDFGTDAYAAIFRYYIDGNPQLAAGNPTFARNPRNGRLYTAGSVKAWYPAPGSRHPYYGTLCYAGQNGFSWSSSVNGSNARYLDFSHGGIAPQYSHYRAYGFQVRCLLE